jgi:hypothetical protein
MLMKLHPDPSVRLRDVLALLTQQDGETLQRLLASCAGSSFAARARITQVEIGTDLLSVSVDARLFFRPKAISTESSAPPPESDEREERGRRRATRRRHSDQKPANRSTQPDGRHRLNPTKRR